MKTVMMWAMVGVIGLVCGVARGDGEGPIVKPGPGGEKPAALQYAGTIAKVEGNKVVLRFGREPLQTHQETLLADSKTEVTLDGKAAGLADLKEGQAAVITYSKGAAKPGEEPTLTATRIEATSGK